MYLILKDMKILYLKKTETDIIVLLAETRQKKKQNVSSAKSEICFETFFCFCLLQQNLL